MHSVVGANRLVCRKCLRTVKKGTICEVCKRCQYCGCTCITCDYCKDKSGRPKRHAYYVPCPVCNRCKASCTCRKIPRNALNLPLSAGAWAPSMGVYNRPITVEVEASNFMGLLREARFVHAPSRVTTDRTVTSGQELIYGPMYGAQIVGGLGELAQQLEEYGVEMDGTCGYHVHVDTRSDGWQTVAALVLLWRAFQRDVGWPHLYLERKLNVHCKPIEAYPRWGIVEEVLRMPRATPTEIKTVLIKFLYGVDVGVEGGEGWRDYLHWKGNKYGRDDHPKDRNPRYADLNLHSVFYRGTVEFRCMGGRVDPMVVVGWPLLCQNLVHLASGPLATCKEALDGWGVWEALHPTIKKFFPHITALKETT